VKIDKETKLARFKTTACIEIAKKNVVLNVIDELFVSLKIPVLASNPQHDGLWMSLGSD
jgi:hypothetical protein